MDYLQALYFEILLSVLGVFHKEQTLPVEIVITSADVGEFSYWEELES